MLDTDSLIARIRQEIATSPPFNDACLVCFAPGKRGRIPENLPPILTRLNIRPENYIKFIKRAEKNRFHFFIGPVERIREVAEKLGRGFFNPDSLWPGRSETVPSSA